MFGSLVIAVKIYNLRFINIVLAFFCVKSNGESPVPAIVSSTRILVGQIFDKGLVKTPQLRLQRIGQVGLGATLGRAEAEGLAPGLHWRRHTEVT